MNPTGIAMYNILKIGLSYYLSKTDFAIDLKSHKDT